MQLGSVPNWSHDSRVVSGTVSRVVGEPGVATAVPALFLFGGGVSLNLTWDNVLLSYFMCRVFIRTRH